MTAREFIINRLEYLTALCDEVSVRYEDHAVSHSHFVEIIPQSAYDADNTYLEWENETMLEFINKFPLETLSFISEDALVKIDMVDFEISKSDQISENPLVSMDDFHCSLMAVVHEDSMDSEDFQYNDSDLYFASVA